MKPKRDPAPRSASANTASELTEEVREIPSLDGTRILRSTLLERGIVRLRERSIGHGDPDGRPFEIDRSQFGLRYQAMDEADSDHGYSTACGVLMDKGLWLLNRGQWDAIVRAVKTRVAPEIWPLVEAQIDPTPFDEEGTISDTLLVTVWAELFAEPLSDVWLAAMAMHAHREGNDFAFGYFIAQIDARQEAERDFLRGQKSVASGKLGGAARKAVTSANSRRTLTEMEKFVQRGLSVRRAAELASKRGWGASTEANRKLWNRHAKKVGT